MAPDLIGKTLSHYQLTELIGESSVGFVFKGSDSRSQRNVLIRVMPELAAKQPDFEEKFLLAARTASRLEHPGLIKVLDYGKVDDYLYIVTEFITGETLAQKLDSTREKREWLPILEVVQIARQLVAALDYANQHGIMHIDINPARIIVKPGASKNIPAQPVLTDAGFSWLATGQNLEQEQALFRSPVYLSPELTRGDPLDIRSDIYSFGVLLYELATAKLPFQAKTVAEVVEYQRKEQIRPPRSRRESLPENLENIILKTLQKDPNKRFQDMASLAEVLVKVESWLALNPPSRPLEPPRPKSESQKPKYLDKLPQTDYLLVEAANKSPITIPISKPEMSIGRGKSADIPLNSLGVSRDHAKLLFDGREYYLIDLDSTNGTFLDDGKLLPGVRDQWLTNKVARIGAFTLKLMRGEKSIPITPDDRPVTQIYRRDGSLAEQKHIHVSEGEGRIGVFLEEDDLEVLPGESIVMAIILRNQGITVDHFRVSIDGVLVSWVSIQPQTVYLMPENQETVQVTYKPPRASTSKAGIYDLTIRVTSVEAPDQHVEVIATLTVLPYVEYTSELHPQKINTNQKARIKIQNQGNNKETFVLTLSDRGDELKFNPPEAQVEVPEGQPGAMEFSARTRRMRIIRKPVTHPYTAQLGAVSGGEKRTFNGEIVSNGFIPAWLPALLAVLCLALGAVSYKVYDVMTKPTPTPTAVPVASATLPFAVGAISGTQLPSVLASTPTPAFTPTPTPFCFGAPPPRVKKGDQAKVAEGGSTLPLRVHQNPEYNQGNVIYQLPIGTTLQVISDPVCVEIKETGKAVIMWQIQVDKKQMKFNDGSSKGWVVEGVNLDYFIEPMK